MKRRKALKSLAWAALSTPIAAAASTHPIRKDKIQGEMVSYLSQWHQLPDMVWTGADFWANQLQDWEIKDGKLRCRHTNHRRNIQLLTHPLRDNGNFLQSSIQMKINPLNSENEGVVGFYWGIQGEAKDYRNICAHGEGLLAGVNQEGHLIFDDLISHNNIEPEMLSEGVDLKLFLNHRGNQVRAELSVWHRGQPMVTLQHHDISPDRLAGHIGLVSDFKEENSTRWSAEFAHWELRGDLLAHFPDRTLGPVYFAQHTLDGDQLYLTAQIAPINPDIKTVELYIRTADDDWEKKDEATIHPHARTASFIIENWKTDQSTEYKLSLTIHRLDDEVIDHPYQGVIPANPDDHDQVTLIAMSGEIRSDSFYRDLEGPSFLHKADITAFFIDRWNGFDKVENLLSEETTILKYLHYWTLFGWAHQEIFQQIPSIIIEADEPAPLISENDDDIEEENSDSSEKEKTDESDDLLSSGDELIKEVIHITQRSHLPGTTIADDKNSRPWIRWEYGGIDLGILQMIDQKGKEEQITQIEETIKNWTKDWTNSEMKVLLSPTVFRKVHDPHVETHQIDEEITENDDPEKNDNHETTTDPITLSPFHSYNKIISLLRKAQITHIAGKHNPPSIIQYGEKDHGDANFAFTIPSLHMNPSLRWDPSIQPHRPILGRKRYTGDFEDNNGNKMTVFAVANPAPTADQESRRIENTGYGIIQMDKKTKRIRFECQPLSIHSAPSHKNPFDDWPFEINQQDHFASRSSHFLPGIIIEGIEDPLVQITKKENDELVSIFRVRTSSSPHVFRVEESGSYKIIISSPDQSNKKSVECSTEMKLPVRLTF